MVGRGTGDAVPLRAAGALIGPDGLAGRWTRIGCACGVAGGPTAFWGGDRRASTMFRPPAKKACEPRMRGESAVVARGGAAPTGAAPVGTFSTPVREEPWRTRQQFPFPGGLPSPSSGGAESGFAAALCSPHGSRAPLGVLNRCVHARIACLSWSANHSLSVVLSCPVRSSITRPHSFCARAHAPRALPRRPQADPPIVLLCRLHLSRPRRHLHRQ